MPTSALPTDLPSDGPDTLLLLGLPWCRYYAQEPEIDLDTRVLLAALGYGDEFGRSVFAPGVLAEKVAAPGPFALAYSIAFHVEAGRLWPGSSDLILVPAGDWLNVVDEEPAS